MTKDWMDLDKKYILPTYERLPIVVKSAKGMVIIDEEGNEFLDLFSGLAVNILGHCHPEIQKEVERQSKEFLHLSNVFYCKPAIELAQKLVDRTFEGKVFFTNSGAESTEAAIKYIHKYRTTNNKNGIIVLKNSFHGRSLGALKLTRMPSMQQDFPMTNMPVYELSGENLEELEDILIENNPAALLFEPILGSGGIQVITNKFMESASELCKKHNVLFCMDEIQTGMGRTGKLFAYQHTNVVPDILIFSKGFGGGLPLGGILVKEEYSNYFKAGDHGTTFAPNPLSAALGNKTIELLYEGVIENVEEKSSYLYDQLLKLKKQFPSFIGDIRGKGLMLGVDMLKDPKKVQHKLFDYKILANITNGNVLRLLPPLIIEIDDIDYFINTLINIFTEWDNII